MTSSEKGGGCYLQKVTKGDRGDLKKVTSFMNKSTEDQTTPNTYYYEIKSKSLS